MKKAFLKAVSALTAVIMLSVNSINCFASDFEDINYHWAKASIESLVEAGIFSGVTKYRFEPDAEVTRGMFAVVACRILNEDPGDRVAFFKDVDNNKYYGPYIAWAFEKQLLTGYEDMTFRADLPVTRQEMFSILARILKYQDNSLMASENYELSYKDKAQISNYALDDIKLLSEKGYIKGNEKNMINPKKNATRAELCSILAKILGYDKIESESEASTEKLTEKTTKSATEKQTEATTKKVVATEKQTEATTKKVVTTEKQTEVTTKVALAKDSSAKTILRNHKTIVLSFNDENGENALRIVYYKQGSEYSCGIKFKDGTEFYIDENRKTVFEKGLNSKLTVYLNVQNNYDKYFSEIFLNDIEDISFINQFRAIKGLKLENISYDENIAIPSYVNKLKSTSASDTKKVTINYNDGSDSFVVNRDAIINIIGGNYEIFVDKECINAYNCYDYMGSAFDLELFVK